MCKLRKYLIFSGIIALEILLMHLLAELLNIPDEIRWSVQSGEENHWVVLVGLNTFFLTIAALLIINARTVGDDYDSAFFRFIKDITFSPKLKAKTTLYFVSFLLIFSVVVTSIFFVVEAIRGVPRLWG
jgi:hypothetical protein